MSEANGWGITDFDLVKMITANPGDVLAQAWQRQAGRLQPGALGDVAVIAARPKTDPFKTILRATEADVRLVVVNGRPLYGTEALMRQAGATHTSEINLNGQLQGQSRRLALTRFDADVQSWSFGDVLKRLEEVRADPKAAIERSRRLAFASIRSGGAPRLRLALDMPTGKVPVGGLPKDLATIIVPPIQPLAHDSEFFASISGRGFHGGLLDGLADFYN